MRGPLAFCLAVVLALSTPGVAQAAYERELMRAAYAGHDEAVSACLANGADPNAADERGLTPLIVAAQQGRLSVAKSLAAGGARLDLADANGYTALIWAAQEGHLPVVDWLLSAGATLRAREKHGFGALEWATRQGHVPVVARLLASGANPAERAPGGRSAIDIATHARHTTLLGLFRPPPAPVRVNWRLLGRSNTGLPIRMAAVGSGPRTVLFIGVVHGDEAQGEDVIARLLNDVERQPALLGDAKLLAIPVANPDGMAMRVRGNARGVDINRNFPTRWRLSRKGRTYSGPGPASEPETVALQQLIAAERPHLIVTFHAAMACNNFDGPAGAIAAAMSRHNGYRLAPNIGYETPGSLGLHAGHGLGIPIVTLEVGHEPPPQLWRKLRSSLLVALAPPK